MWSRDRLGELWSPTSLFSGLEDFKNMDFSVINTSTVSNTSPPSLAKKPNLVGVTRAVQELEGFDIPVVFLTQGFVVWYDSLY